MEKLRTVLIVGPFLIFALAFQSCDSVDFNNDDGSDVQNEPPIYEVNKENLDNTEVTDDVLERHACSNDESDDNHKVSICHIPPGNWAARHTICISVNAVKAHVGHHIAHYGQEGEGETDYFGPCLDRPVDDDERGDSTSDDGGEPPSGDDGSGSDGGSGDGNADGGGADGGSSDGGTPPPSDDGAASDDSP